MSLSPDHSCVSSEKELVVNAESENGVEELRAERNMPPLTGPGGAPIMLPTTFGSVTGLPPDNAFHRDVLFEMPPSISKEQAVAVAATVANPELGNNMDTALTIPTIGRDADSVLDSTFGDQATSRDVVTDTNLHRQQQYILNGRQHQQNTSESMWQQADSPPLRHTTHSGIPFSPPRIGDDTSL
jgi:hypothetical protein